MSEYSIALLAVGVFGLVLLIMAILHKPDYNTSNKPFQRKDNRR